ncbi:MAG TPA: LamG domain-containing protein, partial [Bacteroidia bacterium]
MKKFLHLFLFLCVADFSSGQTANLDSGLVAYYSLSGNANDLSGNGYNGIVNGATLTSDRFGNANNAYNFDGSSSYILIGDPVPAGLQIQNQIALDAWIYATSYPGSSTLGLIVGSQCDGCGSVGASIFLDGRTNSDGMTNPAGHIHFQIGNGSWHQANTNSAVPLNQWVHIVATRKANEDAKIYFNGVLQPSTSVAWTGGISYSGTMIGMGKQKDISNRYFNGKIDEIRIYNRAITPTEVLLLYYEGLNPKIQSSGYSCLGTGSDRLKSTVNANNLKTGITYEYGLDNTYGYTIKGVPDSVAGTTNTADSASVAGLQSGVTYHYRVKAANLAGATYSSDQVFKTYVSKLDSGMIAWYPFSGNAVDSSGNGNNGTVNGATLTTDRFGNANGAYNFNGVNSFIQISSPNLIPAGNSPRAISAWINCAGATTGDKYQSIVSYGTASNSNAFFFERGGDP